jgi:nitroreductase
MNRQAWRIMVVRGPRRDRLLEIISRSQEHMIEPLRGVFSEKIIKISLQVFKNLGGAPAVILIYIPREPVTHASDDDGRARYHGEFKRYNQLLSASALIQNLLLAAHARGLGTCWMTGPKYMEREINELLDITDQELVSVIPIGFPDQSPPAPPRKEDVVRWIGF